MTDDSRESTPPHGVERVSSAPTRSTVPVESVASKLGRYRLLQRVGEGGMGEVWLAEQSEPFRRKVALKLIRAGMDSKQVVARFEAERQALAMMNHPAIAKVFDAGTTDHGVPFFVMEYVQGIPITAYCDRQKVTTRERLELFVRVCEGVQHAHQKGIIHRDLKPSNVLVEQHGNELLPKVIDFGVAKATGARLTDKTLYTELGVMIGTPEYMSPEQAELTGLDVDTRTDVYSLGAMLYELLTGSLPFESRELRSMSFDELRRRIREVDPPRPSTRVKLRSGESEAVAANRRTEPGKLVMRLKGDLDWMVMKALQKDRSRRYASPGELAADIERHLRHEPVLAGPPSTLYLAGKFVRRHRALVAGVVAVVVSLSAGLVMSMTQYFRAEAARRAAILARDDAVSQAAKAEAVTKFLQDMLASTSPDVARGRQVSVREVLDLASARMETSLPDEPLVEAAVRKTIGVTYWALGDNARAEPHLRRALALLTSIHGAEHPDASDLQIRLARLLTNRGERVEAEALLRQAVESARASLGEQDNLTLEALNTLGYVRWGRGDLEEAERLSRLSLEARRRLLGSEHIDTLRSTMLQGMILRDSGRREEAERVFREGYEIARRTLAEDDRWTVHFTNQLGEVLAWLGQYGEAELLLRRALEVRLRIYGEDHMLTTESLIPLSNLEFLRGNYREAESYARRAVAINERLPSRTTDLSIGLLLKSLLAQGKLAEARPYWIDLTRRLRTAATAPDALPEAMNEYAWHLLTVGPDAWHDPGTALDFVRRAVAAPGGENPGYYDTLALAWFVSGDVERAIETQEKAIRLLAPTAEYLRKSFEATLQRYRAPGGSDGSPR